MRLTRLVAERFRNLADLDLRTEAQFVVLSGSNAQGKTNALEAVHLLATLKLLRASRLREAVRWGADDTAVAGWITDEGISHHFRVDLLPTGRVARLDGQRAADLEVYFQQIRAIAFVPHDGRIVTDEPALRRAWLDRAAFTAAPAHLSAVRSVRRCLQQKSAALREPVVDGAVLDALDAELAVLGARLVQRRVALLAELAPHARVQHEAISSGAGALELHYRTGATGSTADDRRRALAELLAQARPAECRRRRTLAGPQTDDVRFTLDGRAVRSTGSRGQVRSVVLALKLAELVAARARGRVPLFLVDDVSSELDRDRTHQLVRALSGLGAQVFATTTDPAHIEGLPRADTLHLQVREGRITVG